MIRHAYPLAALLAASVGCTPVVDVHLEPPAQGYQFSIAPYAVERGTETQRCFFFEIPAGEPVYVNRFEIAQNAGTHHMNVFRVKTVHALGGEPGESVVDGECWRSGNWADWPLVVNSQESDGSDRGYTEWRLPEGVAMRFEPGERIMLQSHYVNATTQQTPLQAKVFVNFHSIPAAEVRAEVGTAFATNQSIRVCPGETDKFFESTCRLSSDQPITIIAANSHFHSRGKRFTISPMDARGVSGDPFYVSTRWDDPPMEWGLDVSIPAGGGVRYRCDYSVPATACGDPDSQCCFTFGGKVETQEHCNVFVYFYPKTRDVGCF